MKRVTDEQVVYAMDKDNPAVLEVKPGGYHRISNQGLF